VFLAVEFPPTSAEWTFFVATFVFLVGPLVVERIGLPGIVGVILGGLIVGPFALGWIERDGVVESLGDLGILVLMFLAGLELDLDEFQAQPACRSDVRGVHVHDPVRAGRTPRAPVRLRARDRAALRLAVGVAHARRVSHRAGARALARSRGGRRRRWNGDDGHARPVGPRRRRRVGRERRATGRPPDRGGPRPGAARCLLRPPAPAGDPLGLRRRGPAPRRTLPVRPRRAHVRGARCGSSRHRGHRRRLLRRPGPESARSRAKPTDGADRVRRRRAADPVLPALDRDAHRPGEVHGAPGSRDRRPRAPRGVRGKRPLPPPSRAGSSASLARRSCSCSASRSPRPRRRSPRSRSASRSGSSTTIS
jgi:Sodium/hydrogen exchanger family